MRKGSKYQERINAEKKAIEGERKRERERERE